MLKDSLLELLKTRFNRVEFIDYLNAFSNFKYELSRTKRENDSEVMNLIKLLENKETE